ncbi:type II toxin-antitoxin system PemK/MazF family toxin [Lacihabitans lacunae]|uniref:Type II toxin-antitoxin system PemK/MazF family toxin n=1 Tax=Lacihabitans lacunae TaxID=1028214 RepID=A0ABV7YYZ5_9BACT
MLVNHDPTIGSEIKKTRPCVVISPIEMNKYLQTIVIAPMTISSKNYPTRVEVKLENKIGWIVLDQIRTIDKQRIIRTLGRLSKPEIKEVKSIIKETYVD